MNFTDRRATVADDSRRAELLAIAADVFSRAGYKRATLRDVADRAGILTGSLYHHFPSKEAMAVELITAFQEDLRAFTTEPGLTADTPLGRIEEFASRLSRLVDHHRAAVGMSMYDAPTTATAAMKDVVRQGSRDLEDRWAALVADAKEAGALRAELDPDALVATLTHTIFGLTSLSTVDSMQTTGQSLIALLLHGLAHDHPPFAELDGSPATATARRVVAGWQERAHDGDRRAQIVAAVRREFARRGYEATTVRDIANALQMRASSLYRHFESKRAMLDEIVTAYSKALLAGYEAVIGAPGTVVERLDALLLLMAAAAARFWEEFRIVRDWWNQLDPGAPPPPDNAARLQLLGELIEEGIASGELEEHPHTDQLVLALRHTLWLPLEDARQVQVRRRHAFLRTAILDGAAAPSAR